MAITKEPFSSLGRRRAPSIEILRYSGFMETTIEIPDGLFDQVTQFAHAHALTVQEVVESGLRKVIAEEPPAKPFRLRDTSVGEGGMVKDFTWPELRAIIYEGRGGE